MSVYLSGNASYNNSTGVYQLTTNSNDAGSLKTSQNASIEYVTQYKFVTPATSNIPYNYCLHIGDDTSNIKYAINGSNFNLTLNNTNTVFSLNNIKPYITYNTSNTLACKVADNAIIVRMNDTNLVKINTSNIPKDFPSASYVMIASSNPTTGNASIFPHQVQGIVFQATPTFENQVNFKQSVKLPTLYTDEVQCTSNMTTSNIFAWSYSNLPILDSVTSTSVTQLATPKAVKNAYDVAVWSSNGQVSLSNAFYTSTSGATSTWSSNTAYWSSNTATATSNAFYNSTAGSSSTFASNAAVFGSNTALWASNNLLNKNQSASLMGSLYIDGSNGNWVGYSIATKKEYIRFGTTDGPGGNDFARIYSEGATNEGKLVIAIQDDMTSTEAFIIRGEAYTGQTKDHLYVRNDGYIGIGTSNPTTTLDVNGSVNAVAFSGTTITNLSNQAGYGSNTAAWASNNIVKSSGGSMDYLNTNKITMPAQPVLIGSGWDYSNGWTALGANGGFVFRNNGQGGLETYTGTSNGGLDMATTITSNRNVGIGTYNPTERFEVAGNIKANSNIYVTSTVGIGTTLPTRKLDVRGDGVVRGAESKNGIFSVMDSNMVSEIKLIAHSNNKSYVEFYSDLYIKRLGTDTTTSAPQLFIGSNGNIGIGMSNDKVRMRVVGYNNQYLYGPHTEAFTYNDNYPVFQQLNWGHNNINLSFDSYYDGTDWRASTTTNAYQMQKLNGLLNFNCCPTSSITAGASIGWVNAMSINENGCVGIGTQTQGLTKLYVDGTTNITGNLTLKAGSSGGIGTFTHLPYSDGKNYLRGTTVMADSGGNVGIGTTTPTVKLDVNGAAKVNSLTIGPNGDELKSVEVFSTTIPSTGTGKFVLDVSGAFPANFVVFPSVESASSAYDDVFAVTVMSKSSSKITFSIDRTDGGGWGQTPTLVFMVVGL